MHTFADKGVIKGTDKVSFELIAIVICRHGVASCVDTCSLECG